MCKLHTVVHTIATPCIIACTQVVCNCTVGYRSGVYARKLRAAAPSGGAGEGIEAFNLRGGILAYVSRGMLGVGRVQGNLDMTKGWQEECLTTHVYFGGMGSSCGYAASIDPHYSPQHDGRVWPNTCTWTPG